jgi:TrmH RNA methyltransferase
VLALFAARPEAMRVLLFREDRRTLVAPMLRYAAERRLPFRCVPEEELEAAADSRHHEGICVRATLPPTRPLDGQRFSPNACLLGLDRVGNPHNLGAILRSMAYFGADGLLLTEEDEQARLSPAALRVAEGGGERVPVYTCRSLGRAQVMLQRQGFSTIGTDARAPRSLFAEALPRPCLVLLGNEAKGLSPAARERCDLLVSIPGSGAVDSLNVSVAAGVLLAELSRTKPKR